LLMLFVSFPSGFWALFVSSQALPGCSVVPPDLPFFFHDCDFPFFFWNCSPRSLLPPTPSPLPPGNILLHPLYIYYQSTALYALIICFFLLSPHLDLSFLPDFLILFPPPPVPCCGIFYLCVAIVSSFPSPHPPFFSASKVFFVLLYGLPVFVDIPPFREDLRCSGSLAPFFFSFSSHFFFFLALSPPSYNLPFHSSSPIFLVSTSKRYTSSGNQYNALFPLNSPPFFLPQFPPDSPDCWTHFHKAPKAMPRNTPFLIHLPRTSAFPFSTLTYRTSQRI